MKHRLKYYWRVFWAFRRMKLMTLTEYRSHLYFWSSISTMWTIFNLFFFGLMVNVQGGLGGWTIPESYLLYAVFTILDSFTWAWFYANMIKYAHDVFSGEFNSTLLKPIDAQFFTMTRTNTFDDVLRFSIGCGTLIWATQHLTTQPQWWQVLLAMILIGCSFIFIYNLWFLFTTFSFWVERLININEVIPAVRQIWQVPRSIYTGIASTVFTVVLPLSLITSVPSEILLGRASWGWVAYFVLFTIGLVLFTRWFFFFSLKKYSGMAN